MENKRKYIIAVICFIGTIGLLYIAKKRMNISCHVHTCQHGHCHDHTHKNPDLSAHVLSDLQKDPHFYPITVIGSGVAGLSAAEYCGRNGYKVLVFEGSHPGGALVQTSYIENWPGVEKILGSSIMQQMKERAIAKGAVLHSDEVIAIDVEQFPFVVTAKEGTSIKTLAIFIATGATPRLLGIPGEEEFWGKGVSTCALCDAPFFKGKEVVVVGGGDAAAEEALQLTNFASKITMLIRSDKMRAAQNMQQRVKESSKITIQYNTFVEQIYGDDSGVTHIKIRKNDAYTEMKTSAVFLAIGQNPNVGFLKNSIRLTKEGYVHLKNKGQQTNVKGVFAAGDVSDNTYRQAGTAAGDAVKASIEIMRWLHHIGYIPEGLSEPKKSTGQDMHGVLPQEEVQEDHVANMHAFKTINNREKKFVMYDFYHDYCPSCLSMKKFIKKVIADFKDKLVFYYVNTIKSPDIPLELGIKTVPTFMIYKDGERIAMHEKSMSEQQLREFIIAALAK